MAQCGVVLDIDGVLHTHGRAIPGSSAAVARLYEMGIPVAFLSNAGGDSEASKAASLSRLLDRVVLPHQVVLAHTPFRHLASAYQGRRVLILGGMDSLAVARDVYGFDAAVSAEQFQAEFPELVPFKIFHDESLRRTAVENQHRRALLSVAEQQQEIRKGLRSVAAVFYFTSMEVDLLNDIQIAVDVLAAADEDVDVDGNVGGSDNIDSVTFYMQADDDLWAASAAVGPRLGESTFRKALEMAYLTTTNKRLDRIVQFGKPRKAAYEEARRALDQQAQYLRLGGCDSVKHSNDEGRGDSCQFTTIFMVGDNLHVDILGANAMGSPWKSVHVQTGVKFAADHGSRYHCSTTASTAAREWGDDEHLALHASIAADGGIIRAGYVVDDLAAFVELLSSEQHSPIRCDA